MATSDLHFRAPETVTITEYGTIIVEGNGHYSESNLECLYPNSMITFSFDPSNVVSEKKTAVDGKTRVDIVFRDGHTCSFIE